MAGYRFAMAPDSVVDRLCASLRRAPLSLLQASGKIPPATSASLLNTSSGRSDSVPASPDPLVRVCASAEPAPGLRPAPAGNALNAYPRISCARGRAAASVGRLLRNRSRYVAEGQKETLRQEHHRHHALEPSTDSLGEDGRYGHFYAGFPEIFRISLAMRLPPKAGRAMGGGSNRGELYHRHRSDDPVSAGRGGRAPQPPVWCTAGAPTRHGRSQFDGSRTSWIVLESRNQVTASSRRTAAVSMWSILITPATIRSTSRPAGPQGPGWRRHLRNAKWGQQRIAEQLAEIAAFFDIDVDH